MDTQAAAMNETLQCSYLGRLSMAIVAALAEAMALVDEGNIGQECGAVVRHSRELYNVLLDELATAGPSGTEFARGLADSIGARLDDLERRTIPAIAQVDNDRPDVPVSAGSWQQELLRVSKTGGATGPDPRVRASSAVLPRAKAEPSDTWYVRNMSEALVAALAEAKAMIDAGKFGPDLIEVVRHARELHEILVESVAKADTPASARLGPAYAAMGANIAQLEGSLRARHARQATYIDATAIELIELPR